MKKIDSKQSYYEKCFFPSIDSCLHVVTISKFALKNHVTDTLCEFHMFVVVF